MAESPSGGPQQQFRAGEIPDCRGKSLASSGQMLCILVVYTGVTLTMCVRTFDYCHRLQMQASWKT